MRPPDAAATRAGPRPLWLSEFIRQHTAEILAEWTAAIRALPIARDLPRPALLDHLPALLARIAQMIDEEAAGDGRSPAPGPAPAVHALARLDEGYNLGEVVAEYALLRDCVLRKWEEHGVRAADPSELRVLNRAIDYAISVSVARFTTARERTLRALDRISAAALGTDNLEAFLPALLLVLRETTPAVDWALVRLRAGEALVVRAAVGLEEAVAARDAVRIGEGFAGRIALAVRPLAAHAAAGDPGVASDVVRAAGTLALFGVPLVHGGQVIGVVEVGSRTAAEFSEDDRLLVTMMATRATAMIEQHRLRALAEERAAAAQHATRTRDELLAVVSHDLRNPLAAIVTAAALLDGDAADDPAGVRRKGAVIARAAGRMARLLEDLLEASRIEAGGLTLARAPHPVAALVHDAIEAQRPLAEPRQLALRGEVAPGLPAVCVDRERIARVFANLLGNALKFTPPGGAVIVRARADDASGGVRFEVADTGSGIAAEELPRIFDRYWQSPARAREGAGLGLPIARGIVEAHGGRIGVESVVGRGTTFFFTLPAVDQAS